MCVHTDGTEKQQQQMAQTLPTVSYLKLNITFSTYPNIINQVGAKSRILMFTASDFFFLNIFIEAFHSTRMYAFMCEEDV